MLLRWLINTALRSAAEQKIRTAVTGAVKESLRTSLGAPSGEHDPQQTPSSPPLPIPSADQTPEHASRPCQIAFVFALGIESGGMVGQLTNVHSSRRTTYFEHWGVLDHPQFSDGHSIVIAESGVGRQAAAAATAEIIETHHPAWIVATGFAGALQEDINRRHLVMANAIRDESQGESGEDLEVALKIDPRALAAAKGVHLGRLLTVDRLIRHRQERLELGQKHQAIACDMESAAVAQVCREAKTRFMAVRLISDGLDDELPPEVESLLEQKSLAAKLGAAAGAIFQRPAMVKDLWKLREEARKASNRLATFLVSVAEQLEV